MSYLSSHRQDWRSSAAYAFGFASVAGAVTTVGCVGGMVAWIGHGVLADPHLTWGYRIGMILAALLRSAAVAFVLATVCALGLGIFGALVSHRLGDRLVARWTAFPCVLWGAVSGSLFWWLVSALVSGWDFEWPALFLVGAIFGAPTGFWWWFFYRRVLIRRASVQN